MACVSNSLTHARAWRPPPGPAVPSAAEARADRLLHACLAGGLSFKVGAGTVATLCPPLTIAEADVDAAMEIQDAALSEVARA